MAGKEHDLVQSDDRSVAAHGCSPSATAVQEPHGEDEPSAAFTPAGSTIPMSWHIAVALGAAACVAALYFGLAARTTKGAWLHDFFFERSFVQWLTLYVFCFGLGLLVERVCVHWRELRAFRARRVEILRSPGAIGVSRRFRRLHIALRRRPSAEVHSYAKQLAEADATDLEFGYSVMGEVIQILPLLGFFGTVLGLSLGLHQAFLTETKSAIQPFAAAIGTAFDTTLLGLACCIILIILQLVIRKREDALLANLDRAADNFVARYYLATPAEPAARDDSIRLLDAYSTQLKELVAQAGQALREEIAKVPSIAVKSFQDALATVANRILDQSAQRDGESAKLLAATLREGLQPIQQTMTELEKQAVESLAKAFRENTERFWKEFTDSVNRPRRITFVDQPETGIPKPEP